MRVLVLGATGRVGSRCVAQLLERGHEVVQIVRSSQSTSSTHARIISVNASLLGLSVEELAGHIKGCDAVLSGLGHRMDLWGIPFLGLWKAPRDLCFQAASRICKAIEEYVKPEKPIKVIFLSSAGIVLHGDTNKEDHGKLTTMAKLIPPVADNQRTADFFLSLGSSKPHIEWAMVRPDNFIEGAVSEYKLQDKVTYSVFSSRTTRMDNIAHFMCELAEKDDVWNEWRFKLPVIGDAEQATLKQQK